MAFQKLNYDKDWTSAEDFPTYESDEVQVRKDMQYHPNAIRDFINALLDTLTGKNAAAEIGAVNGEGGASTMQTVLDAHAQTMEDLREEITSVANGGVPLSEQSAEITFNTASWVKTDDGYKLNIAPSDHKRKGAGFGYSIYHYVSNIYRSGTWAAAATRVSYDNGNIVLLSDSAYKGKIVVFGLGGGDTL